MNSPLTGKFKGTQVVISNNVSTNYTFDDSVQSVNVDATSGAVIVTLPLISGNEGRILNIRKTDASVNTVTIAANGSDTIQGSATIVLSDQWEFIQLENDGTEWLENSSSNGSVDVTLAAIGGTPNANAATLSGQVLNLEPASASFGGVITTGTQSFAGVKTFTNSIVNSDILGLAQIATVSLPTAAPGNEGYVVYDSTTNTVKFSDGSSWTNIGSGGASSGIAGSVQFSNGASGFNSDATKLFWDNTNKRLGIGTGTPSWQFHAVGASTSHLYFTNGFSSNSPGITVDNPSSGKVAVLTAGATGSGINYDASGFFNIVSDAAATIRAGTSGNSGTYRIRIDTAGNIGINNSTPSESLDVTGNVRFSGALMPNNSAGTSGQVLTSAGTGSPPTWTTLGSGTSSGIAGSVQFSDGASNFSSDATKLFWDNTNKRLGIGTGSPSTTLQVSGQSTFGGVATPVVVSSTDTTGTVATIQLVNNAGSNGHAFIEFIDTSASMGTINGTDAALSGNIVGINFFPASGKGVGFRTGSTNRGGMDSSGNFYWDTNSLYVDITNHRVGILTTSPGYPLSVAGVIHSSSGGFRFPDGTTQTTAAAGGTGSSGILGSVQFSDGSSGFSSDATKLFWDNTNKRLGIGTGSPATTLQVSGVSTFGGAGTPAIISSTDTGGSTPALQIVNNAGGSGNPFFEIIHNTVSIGTINGVNSAGFGNIVGLNFVPVSGKGVGFRQSNTNRGGMDSSGNFYWNTNTLFVNVSTGRTGIGTSSPSWLFHTVGNSTSHMYFTNGFNSNGPNIVVDNPSTGKVILMQAGTGGSGLTYDNSGPFNIVSDAAATLRAGTAGNSGTFRLRIDTAGNVGINNSSPSESLDVTGNLRFSGALKPNNAAGTSGQVLTSAGASSPPTWTTPITGSGSSGSVTFWSGTSTISQDSTNFFWDNTNKRLGIGTNSPSTLFHVNGVSTLGGNTTISGLIYFSTTNNITAFAGGGQGSATALTTSINFVTTVASSGDSVKLPTGVAGLFTTVFNLGANSMDIFPISGSAIDALGTNVAYSLAAGSSITFYAQTATQWRSQ